MEGSVPLVGYPPAPRGGETCRLSSLTTCLGREAATRPWLLFLYLWFRTDNLADQSYCYLRVLFYKTLHLKEEYWSTPPKNRTAEVLLWKWGILPFPVYQNGHLQTDLHSCNELSLPRQAPAQSQRYVSYSNNRYHFANPLKFDRISKWFPIVVDRGYFSVAALSPSIYILFCIFLLSLHQIFHKWQRLSFEFCNRNKCFLWV